MKKETIFLFGINIVNNSKEKNNFKIRKTKWSRFCGLSTLNSLQYQRRLCPKCNFFKTFFWHAWETCCPPVSMLWTVCKIVLISFARIHVPSFQFALNENAPHMQVLSTFRRLNSVFSVIYCSVFSERRMEREKGMGSWCVRLESQVNCGRLLCRLLWDGDRTELERMR